VGDELGEARALRALSWAFALNERPDEALHVGRRALEILQRHDDPWELALCLERVGQASYDDQEGSIRTLEQALRLYRQVGDRRREAVVLYKIAERVAQRDGEVDVALSYAERAIAIADELGSTHDGAHARLEHGKILRRCGRLADAADALSQALADTTKAGDERCTVRALTAFGVTLIETGDIEDAEAALREGLGRGRHLSEEHTARVAIAGLARIRADAGQPRDAAALFGFAENLPTRGGAGAFDEPREIRTDVAAGLRGVLGDECEKAWAQGRDMTLDEAVELALGPV
jgi:tetratricopeptide (TPR) repeat protein